MISAERVFNEVDEALSSWDIDEHQEEIRNGIIGSLLYLLCDYSDKEILEFIKG